MISTFRKNQRSLMLVIAILTIIAFIFFYNPAETGKLGTNTVATIYGKNLTQADIDREVKNFNLTLNLQQFDLIEGLGGMAQNENEALVQFVWNRLVLQHQAGQLGIEPTDAQVLERIMSLGIFQTSGQFDPRKYNEFKQDRLAPNGFTERQIENIMRDVLRFERLQLVVGAPVTVSEGEVREAGRAFEKVDLQVVRFPVAEVLATIQVPVEEVKSTYEQNKARMNMPELRMVEYVEFALPADKQTTQGREKIDAQQKVADTASAFAQSAAGKDFSEAAKAAGLTVQTTPEFAQSGAIIGATQDAAVVTRDVAPAAFILSQGGISDVVEGTDKYYIIKLAKISPQRQMTFEEASPQLETRLKAMKAESLITKTAETQLGALRAGLTAGKPFAEAATAAGVQAEALTGLDPQSETLTPEQRSFIEPTLLMQPGQLSNLVVSPTGGFAVYLSKRDALPGADLAKQQAEVKEEILTGKQKMLFATWLNASREAAKITMAQRQGAQ